MHESWFSPGANHEPPNLVCSLPRDKHGHPSYKLMPGNFIAELDGVNAPKGKLGFGGPEPADPEGDSGEAARVAPGPSE